tara:strand:- start:32 stop:460 length:429 start_codon:yes stop_codon:yes gene_type:complete
MSEAPARLDRQAIQDTFERSPFISTLGLTVEAVDYDAGELTVRMPMSAQVERRAGTKQFHGGPIAAFIDVVGDFAIGMLLGGGVPTINIRIDYLKPAVGEAITACAKVRRHGRTVTVVDIDVTDEKGSLVAVGRGTYASQTG